MHKYHARKLFTILRTEKGKQLFYNLYSKLIMSYKHRRGQYLFTLDSAVNNFYRAKKVEYGNPNLVHVFFWQHNFDLGVICLASDTGAETYIEL